MSMPLTLISLNTWGGIGGTEKLLAFFKDRKETDIFCLQEIWNGGAEAKVKQAAGRSLAQVDPDLLAHIQDALPDHQAFFQENYISYFGITIFVHKRLHVLGTGAVCIYREPGYVSSGDIADHARMLQSVTIETAGGPVSIFNTHAAWQPGGKLDTPERLEQSKRILKYTDSFTHPLILAGDFNLMPETQSVHMLETADWQNLIRSHGILSTRTSFYDKPEKFADYIFLKNGIQINEFRVLPDEVSDHAALFLQFTPQVL